MRTGCLRVQIQDSCQAEDAAIDHGMHTFDIVDGLRDMQVDGEAAQRIGFIPRNPSQRDDPIQHFVQSLSRGVVEIGV
jgi:hypothetical protein